MSDLREALAILAAMTDTPEGATFIEMRRGPDGARLRASMAGLEQVAEFDAAGRMLPESVRSRAPGNTRARAAGAGSTGSSGAGVVALAAALVWGLS